MLELDDYEAIRIDAQRIAVLSSHFTRGEDKGAFLAGLREDGFTLRRSNGEEVPLKAVNAELSYSIGGAEVLIIQIDGSLDEKTLM